MRLKELPSEFQKALPIIKKIKDAGYEAYFVGGSVRDVLLSRPIHDVDIATSSYPQETKAIFPRTVDVGIEHGTVLVLEEDSEYEITTFRTEDVYVDYRRPSQVSFVRSLEEDLKRRDFTVNALALDDQGEIIDKFSGLEDIDAKLLRAVGKAEERFEEDALRIMRGFRFVATLNFSIEEKTFEAMCTHAPLLEKISVERSFIEFDQLMMAPFWKNGLQKFMEASAFDYLPGLHHKGFKLGHLMQVLPQWFRFETSAQAWANLILELEIPNPKAFLKVWKTSNEFQKEVQAILSVYQLRQENALDKRTLYQYGKGIAYLSEKLIEAKGLASDFAVIDKLYDELVIYDKHDIVVNGSYLIKHMKMTPGPELGQLLKKVELAIVDGMLANQVSEIEQFVIKELTY
ncbi:CCA tRNA nucleotidyltransferase [Streptococcus iniae]|uniref:CCA tRNA nucleotidyltransferase n=1 Tax=Streptococcus iniae TaxID=1346 RepID=UPI002B30A1C4|nr:CCA tRNA nucleotidyltransferase [Streptococcus iniae]